VAAGRSNWRIKPTDNKARGRVFSLSLSLSLSLSFIGREENLLGFPSINRQARFSATIHAFHSRNGRAFTRTGRSGAPGDLLKLQVFINVTLITRVI
jgi:hypothetical protein